MVLRVFITSNVYAVNNVFSRMFIWYWSSNFLSSKVGSFDAGSSAFILLELLSQLIAEIQLLCMNLDGVGMLAALDDNVGIGTPCVSHRSTLLFMLLELQDRVASSTLTTLFSEV